MKSYQRFFCKAMAFVFIVSNLMVSLPHMEIVFAKDKNDNPKTEKVKYEDREKTELIIKYKVNKESNVKNRLKQNIKLTRLQEKKKFKKLGVDLLEIGMNDDMDKVLEILKSDPDVEYVQPNYKLDIQALPTDTRFNEQWGLSNSGQEVEGASGRSGVDIDAVDAWNLTKGTSAVIVGVLDTGIDISHNDLKNSIYVNPREIAGNGIDDDNNGYVDDINGWDFVNEDNTVFDSASLDLHGTHVAGIIAASANSEGISGVAPNVKLLPLKFIYGSWGYTCDAIDAIEYAMSMGVKIINCSFGGTDNNYALKDTMVNSGILYICSAGNRGADVAVSPVYPACFDIPNVLSVASIDSMGVISPYSSYGSKIHVAAPGINILSTTPGNTYEYLSGTSESVPFVTGIAALLKSSFSTMGYAQIAQRIKDNVVPCTNLQGKVTTGGRVSAYAALANVKPAADTYTGPGNDTGTVPGGQQGGNEDTWYTQEQLAKIKEKLHYGEGGVNPASGNYSFTCTDLSVPAPGFQVNISRTYNSKDGKSIPLGQGWTFGFEGYVDGSNVVSVVLPDGRVQRFRLENGVYKPEDSRSTLVKNPDNTYTLTTKDQYKYYFNTGRYLYKMEDRNGNTVSIDVDTEGKVKKVTDAVGREYIVNYNTNNLISSITAPESITLTYEYDTNKRLIKVTDAAGGTMNYSYDTWGYITEIKDHYGKTITKIVYNHNEGENQHKVSQTTDSNGNIENYSYDMTNKKTTVTDNNGRISTYWFDSSMYTIREQDPEGRSVYTEYFLEGGKNKYGDVKSVTDRNGNKTEYTIDDRGNVTRIINPDGSLKQYAYDEKNNLIKEVDEAGICAYYIYDTDKKLLVKKAQPLNKTDEYTAAADQAKFAITAYEYYTAAEAQAQFLSNAKALLKSVTDPEGNITTYTYDADGNIKTEKSPEGKVTTNTYNRIGLNTNTATPKGYNTQYVYDSNGFLEKVVRQGGETTRTVYDKMGRKLQEISPNQYDAARDNLSGHTYTDSTAGYRYEYFDSGNLKSVIYPENNTTVYTYDTYGNKLTETRPDGSIYRYEYDIMDRLKKVYFKEGTAAAELLMTEYSYAILEDKKTQETETLYLNDTDRAITVSIYDYAGRLAEIQYPDGTRENTVYNPNGTVSSICARDGSITYCKYDGLDRLNEQWSPMEITDGVLLYTYASFEYDKASRKTAEKAGKEKVALFEIPADFVVKSYVYYRDGNLKTVTDSEGRKTEYLYDDDGNLSREDVYTAEGSMLTTGYEYNHLGKAEKRKTYVNAGDIYGNSFESTEPMALETQYTYDKNGNLKTQTTPDMVVTTYTYDRLDRQIGISQPGVDENGVQTDIENTFTYNWEGKILTKTDARGYTTKYEYNKQGYLTKVTDARDGVTACEYDRAGRKLVEVSPENYAEGASFSEMNRVGYVYDVMGRLKGKLDIYKDKSGRWNTIYTKTYQYDVNGNVTKELDAMGYEEGEGETLDERIYSGYGTEYTYDLSGNALTILDPVTKQRGLPYTAKYEYDALGRKTGETDAREVVTVYRYDDAGNVLSVKVKKNAGSSGKPVKDYTYDLAGRKLTETDGNGNTVAYEYNAFGKVRRIIYPGDSTIDGNTAVLQYDTNSNLKLRKDSMGRAQLNQYDNQGRIISVTDKKEDDTQSITVYYKYDKNGNKRFETDGNGNTKEAVYDELNRLAEAKHTVSGAIKSTVYEYDKNGNQTTAIDWRGNVYTNVYDPLNRLIEKTDPYTTVEKLEYNKNSWQVKSCDALGNVTQYIYDRNGRLINTIDPEGHITSQTYDDIGNIQSKSDGRGITTVYGYDEFNRLISVTNAKGETTSYTYDMNGNMLTQTDAEENTTIYEYNCINKLIRRMDHGGRVGKPGDYTYIKAKTEVYTYNADGTMKAKTDRSGKTTDYTYDIYGRLTEQKIDGSIISYTYDNNGNQLTMTDGTGITERAYDEESRVTEKTVPEIGTTEYRYDIMEADGGYAEESTDPKGNITKKIYDKAGRLIEVEAEKGATSYTYYDNGSRKNVQYPDGSREAYTYYRDSLVKSLVNTKADGTILDSYSYTYDSAHNQTGKTDSKGTTRYEYDSLNRLEKVTEPDGKTTSYIFDKAGNRLQELVLLGNAGAVTTYTYNEQNRLMNTVTTNGGTTEKVTYEYDSNGNTLIKVKETTKPVDPELSGSFVFKKAGTSTTREATFMDYDVWNQLIKTVEADKTILCRYNGDGLRVEKTVNGETRRFLYEGDKVVLEVDGGNTEVARNTYGSNLLSRTADGETSFYMYNGHGDVTALIGTDGIVQASYYYDAFGNPVAEGTNENGINNPIRYAGYQWDGETEIYYLNARYYDPKIARFLTEDTYYGSIADPLSLNLYAYCANNPIMYVDPTGHAFTTWDNEHVTNAADRKAILDATKEWADAKTDAARKAAHDKAEKARDKYRGTEYEGSDDGTTYKKGADRDKEHKELLKDVILYDKKGYYKDTDKISERSGAQAGETRVYLNSNDIHRKALGEGNPNIKVTALSGIGDFVKIVGGGTTYYGGDQSWFNPNNIGVNGGCGTTAAANIMAYLASKHPELKNLYGGNINNITEADFKKYMQEMYKYVTPIEGIEISLILNGKTVFEGPDTYGVPTPNMFTSGVKEFAQDRGITLQSNSTGIFTPLDNAVSFVREGLKKDSPVALLAWPSTKLNNIDFTDANGVTTKQNFQMHWVTVTGMSENKKTGETTVEVSTWGGTAYINLNDAWSGGSMFFSKFNVKH